MKEAAGEANMTIITIVLIAVVLTVGGIIVNNMLNSTEKSTCCTSDGGVWSGGKCYTSCQIDKTSGTRTCTGEFTPKCSS